MTLSKPWGGCGIAIGWVACQDSSIIQRLADAQYFGTACPNRASEIQAIMTLRASDAILNKNLEIVRQNLGLLSGFMDRYSDLFEWVWPKAGAIAFIRFKGPRTIWGAFSGGGNIRQTGVLLLGRRHGRRRIFPGRVWGEQDTDGVGCPDRICRRTQAHLARRNIGP